jgi:cobalt-precorrin-5B (C1)-methyltransferase
MQQTIYKNQKRLRCGYTTGTCAAAATKAAAYMLLSGSKKENVEIITPSGLALTLQVEDIHMEKTQVSCAVRKDSGDDPDITNGILVYSKVTFCEKGFFADGGIGVGRVTKKGLQQEVGSAAINPVPMQMIKNALESVADLFSYEGGLNAEIYVPDGEKIAKKTFNPRLGIEGGISILGTSGIVEPMSEQALIDTIRAEMKMHLANGEENLLVTPGNYGQDFLAKEFGIDIDKSIKCSNFIGDMLDMACEFQAKSVLLTGHIGKLVKLGAGVMNTHSRYADARMETLAACVVQAGGTLELTKKVLSCITTDEALEYIKNDGILDKAMQQLRLRVEKVISHRVCNHLQVEVICFSNEYGVLFITGGAVKLLERMR